MICSDCQYENPAGAKFCNACGATLEQACSSCGQMNPPGSRFCNECGTPLTRQSKGSLESSVQRLESRPILYTPKHLAEQILAEQAAMEARGATDGERKTITALFADMAGFTALAHGLDPEAVQHIIDPALQLVMDAVHRYDGFVAQSLGDGIFIRLEKGVPVQIRVGINTGEVVLRSVRKDDLHTDYVPVGHSTNLASRMESLATPGSIVVSENTYKLVEGYFECKALGAMQVKGIDEPVHIYEVLGVGPLRTRLQVAARRGLARFVGRQSEMEQMRRALEQAKEGHGQIVAVMGEPGLGKSRLFYEFVRAYRRTPLPSQPGCLVLETFSVSHGKAYPYLPLIDLLKNYFQIALQNDERTRREKVTGKVLTLDRSLEDTLPYLFFLLGIAEPTSSLAQMDPQIRRRRTFEAIKRLLVRESLNQPLILIFEDLHWLDSETQTFLTLLSESVATARVLLLVNYRPEYHHEWGSKTYYMQLRLDPLGQEDAEEMLTVLLGEKVGATHASPLQGLKQFILTKTEGNPFFMEEIVQALVEQGVFPDPRRVGTAHPPPTLAKSLADIKIPPTVQGILASRIDRLPPEEKELLLTLSVIGKEFPLNLLKQVVDKPEDKLHGLLSHLQVAEFIYEQPAFPEVEYTFKHALTQEVAYNSLLQERRKVLHERMAQAIEALFHSRLEDHCSELAHHYSRSGNTEKAVEYLQRAGRQAVQHSAYAEAITHLTAALGLLKTLPDTPERTQQELVLQLALGVPLMAIKGYAAPEAEKTYTRARDLCQQIGETLQLFRVLRGLCTFYLTREEFQTVRELGEQLLRLAQRVQDPALLLLAAHYTLGATWLYLGEFAPARAHLEKGIALYDLQQHRSHAFRSSVVFCLSHAAWALWYLGYPDQALKRSHEALTQAQELSRPFSLALALDFVAVVRQLRREGQAAQERWEAAISLSSEQGFPLWLALGATLRGWALAEQGQGEEGIAQMRQGLAAWRAIGTELTQLYCLALLAEAHGKAGQVEEGLSVLAEALDAVHKTGECWYEDLYRLKGELSLKSRQVKTSQDKSEVRSPKSEVTSTQHPTPSPQAEAEAEACFLKAIEIARRQSAKSLELRAVMSLSRLWQQQGKKEEARRMLAEIYGWFTEGFDTKDLQEAKVLLEEPGEQEE